MQELNRDNYHSNYAYVSKSALDVFAKSPLHYWHRINAEEEEKTPALVFGSFLHMLVLEPHLVKDFYYLGSIDRRTKEGKEKAAEIEKLNLTIISDDDVKKAEEIKNAIFEHPRAKKLLDTRFGVAEQIYTSVHQQTGLPIKCRLDWYNNFYKSIVDIKTIEDGSLFGFTRSTSKYKYYMQAAYYIDILRTNNIEVQNFYFICVEKKAPYAVSIYELSADYIDYGRAEYNRLLMELAESKKKALFMGYNDDQIIEIQLPTYLK